MLAAFGDYARYYDLLYREKPYDAEVGFVMDRLAESGGSVRRLLDLGCGTGRHAGAFARHGVTVEGVDLSGDMVELGNRELASSLALGMRPHLQQGDARTFRADATFDVVVSLFHVISYQTTAEDLIAHLRTAAAHLRPGGLFFFDFWHGPGVILCPPENRFKELEDESILVQRRATAHHELNTHRVDVVYDIDVTDKAAGETASLQETHRLRYWFLPELRYFARLAGLRAVSTGAWMETREPKREDWTAWMLLRRETEVGR